MSTQLEPMSFKQWLELNPHLPRYQDCSECRGTGRVECPHCNGFHINCHQCAGSREVECEECHGFGVIDGAYIAYTEQREKDKALLRRYQYQEAAK